MFGISEREVYTRLPMGWSWSPYLVDLALAVLDAKWRSEGMYILRYVDDLLSVGAPQRGDMPVGFRVLSTSLRPATVLIIPDVLL